MHVLSRRLPEGPAPARPAVAGAVVVRALHDKAPVEGRREAKGERSLGAIVCGLGFGRCVA